jgi:NADPH-dependent 2,4-dienoyl-CoA reductase/sulfur reductase-like enzyme
MTADERCDGGLSVREAAVIGKILEEAGADALDITSGIHGRSDKYMYAPATMPQGYNVPLAAAVKKAVSIPVMVVGSIMKPEIAEDILEQGKADYICIAKGLLADPELPRKWQTGRTEDVRPCIRCLYCCTCIHSQNPVRCAVNPANGQQAECLVSPAEKRRRVAVVGGGPAGMEAAITAAQRGHEVTLFEKRKTGGMLVEAAVPEFKEDIRELIRYLSLQVQKAGVKTVSGEATGEIIKDGGFDAAIVATGAFPHIPDLPGTDMPNVVGPLEVLRGARTGKRVIVVGGGLVGRDVALFLAERGKKVVITTRSDTILRDENQYVLGVYYERLSRQDATICTGVELEKITDKGVIVRDKPGTRGEIEGDTVVLAGGFAPERKLVEELRDIHGLEVHAIGDCVEPRRIHDAIHEGFFTARGL